MCFVKDIEADFGSRLVSGEDFSSIIVAAGEGAAKHVKGQDRQLALQAYHEGREVHVAAGDEEEAETSRKRVEEARKARDLLKAAKKARRRKMVASTDTEVEGLSPSDPGPAGGAPRPGYQLARWSRWAGLGRKMGSKSLVRWATTPQGSRWAK